MGIFAWQFLVRPFGHFSAWAGGVALAAMMIPQVARTTEEIVRTVPVSLREAALALGYARWRTSLSIVLRTASAGIVTGALVAIARIAGETAPLLFTAFGNQFWSTSLNRPMAALPLQIFNYAVSPYDDWHAQAWAGALVLIAMILIISLDRSPRHPAPICRDGRRLSGAGVDALMARSTVPPSRSNPASAPARYSATRCASARLHARVAKQWSPSVAPPEPSAASGWTQTPHRAAPPAIDTAAAAGPGGGVDRQRADAAPSRRA